MDAVILAMAGLARLGLLDGHAVPLDPEECLPQAGQGALAIESLISSRATNDVIGLVDDAGTRACVEAERAVLAGLAAGCQAPIAAYATLSGDCLRLRAYVGLPNGRTLREDRSRNLPGGRGTWRRGRHSSPGTWRGRHPCRGKRRRLALAHMSVPAAKHSPTNPKNARPKSTIKSRAHWDRSPRGAHRNGSCCHASAVAG